MTPAWTNIRPLRVLHAIDSLRLGGAEALLATLVRELTAHGGVESHVYVNDPTGAEPKLVKAIEEHGTTLEMGANQALYDPRLAASVRRMARSVDADVVHSQLCVANVASRLAARTAGKPHLTTVQTTPGPLMEDSRARAMADAGTARLSKIMVAVSPSVADAYSDYAHLPRSRFRVVPNTPAAVPPVDFDRDAKRAELAPGATRIVVCIARLQPEKGIDELLEATAIAAPRVPGLHVVVCGGGPEEERLRAAVRERGIESSLTLLGNTPDVASVLAAADVFCLPSRNEGLPLSLLEAMMFELPCVATSVGGIPSVIEDGVSGLLVPPREPARLADALVRVTTDDQLAASLAREGKRIVDASYSPAAIARSYVGLYEELASR